MADKMAGCMGVASDPCGILGCMSYTVNLVQHWIYMYCTNKVGHYNGKLVTTVVERKPWNARMYMDWDCREVTATIAADGVNNS